MIAGCRWWRSASAGDATVVGIVKLSIASPSLSQRSHSPANDSGSSLSAVMPYGCFPLPSFGHHLVGNRRAVQDTAAVPRRIVDHVHRGPRGHRQSQAFQDPCRLHPWRQPPPVALSRHPPQRLPEIFTGMRVAMGVCWGTVVAAELVAAESGVGFMIMVASTFTQIDRDS